MQDVRLWVRSHFRSSNSCMQFFRSGDTQLSVMVLWIPLALGTFGSVTHVESRSALRIAHKTPPKSSLQGCVQHWNMEWRIKEYNKGGCPLKWLAHVEEDATTREKIKRAKGRVAKRARVIYLQRRRTLWVGSGRGAFERGMCQNLICNF